MEIDTDIFLSPGFWLLTAGAIVGLWIGFAAASAMGSGYPWYVKLIITLFIPAISYFFVQRLS